MFKYFKLQLKFIRPMLATNPEASIYEEHILQKAKKQIQEVNRLSKKVAKSKAKYVGAEIPEAKEVAELQGIVRAYQQLLGKNLIVPDGIEDLLALSATLEEEFKNGIAEGEQQKATVFMRDTDGWPLISTHMILGNIKEVVRILTNNGEQLFTAKTKAAESLSLDVKAIEQFVRPSHDIMRDENGKRQLLVRPITFELMGKRKTAIAMSEQLPAGTTISMTLRVRETSQFADQQFLENILDYGKSLGLGAWRSSGNCGAYRFMLDEIDMEETADEDGFR